jgi:Flp pilus assembly protein TadD
VRAGRAPEAQTLLEQATTRARPDPRYQLHLAEAYLRSGDVPKARASFNQARDADLMSYILTRSDHQAIEALSQTPAP